MEILCMIKEESQMTGPKMNFKNYWYVNKCVAIWEKPQLCRHPCTTRKNKRNGKQPTLYKYQKKQYVNIFVTWVWRKASKVQIKFQMQEIKRWINLTI